MHKFQVELHESPQDIRLYAVYLYNVKYTPRAFYSGVVLSFQVAFSLVLRYRFYPSQLTLRTLACSARVQR